MIDQEIIVFSAARTGSTLIWQCLSQVFKKVHKAQESPHVSFQVPPTL